MGSKRVYDDDDNAASPPSILKKRKAGDENFSEPEGEFF